jgi:hypothetical protein
MLKQLLNVQNHYGAMNIPKISSGILRIMFSFVRTSIYKYRHSQEVLKNQNTEQT